jgi:hypothetical protein
MIGTKENIKIGDIVQAHDFPPREGRGACFIIGKVKDIDGSFFVADTLLRIWDGEKTESQFGRTFRALAQGEMGFDKDYERVTILA